MKVWITTRTQLSVNKRDKKKWGNIVSQKTSTLSGPILTQLPSSCRWLALWLNIGLIPITFNPPSHFESNRWGKRAQWKIPEIPFLWGGNLDVGCMKGQSSSWLLLHNNYTVPNKLNCHSNKMCSSKLCVFLSDYWSFDLISRSKTLTRLWLNPIVQFWTMLPLHS